MAKIIGSGLLAKTFEQLAGEKIIIFASGVSYSQESDESSFKRESDLLEDTLESCNDLSIVYFSSCDIFRNQSSRYILHKLEMEEKIKKSGVGYYIFRLPQAVGLQHRVNATLVNFFINSLVLGKKVFIQKYSIRYLMDVEDILSIVSYVVSRLDMGNSTYNLLPAKGLSAPEIYFHISSVLNISGNYELVNTGSNILIPQEDIFMPSISRDRLESTSYCIEVLDRYVKAISLKIIKNESGTN